MRALVPLALCLLALAGCSSPDSPAAANDAEAPSAFTGHVEEWDAATWGHICVDLAGGCFGQHSWEDGKDEYRVQVPEGATAASLEISWEAVDPRNQELRIYASRSGVDAPLAVAGPSPLHLDLAPLLADGHSAIVVNGDVAGLADLPAKAHEIQWYHVVATFS